MIVRKQTHGYSSQRKYVQGKGFVDSLTSSLRSIGSYVSQNKDLIAKPLLGAAGDLAATGLLEGGKAAINAIKNRKKGKASTVVNNVNHSNIDPGLSPKHIEILKSIMLGDNQQQISMGNIIGGGIKRF
jgi:hypothetical protein